MHIQSKKLNLEVNRNPWFFNFGNESNQAKIRLICFPFAGGSASFFRNWQILLKDQIELIAIELPGRASRIKEPFINNGEELLDQLEKLDELYQDKPFAFFGHSMGATIAFELARRLEQKSLTLPEHLFVSGRQAPQTKRHRKILHKLPENEFIKEIASLNGMPREVLDNAELMELVSPVLRADCKLLETWDYVEGNKLKVNITALFGDQDPSAKKDTVKKWANLTCESFNSMEFSGDHFFINTKESAVVEAIKVVLELHK